MKVIWKYIVFMLFIYNFNIFNIDAEKPFSGTLNKVYVCMHACMHASLEQVEGVVEYEASQSAGLPLTSQGINIICDNSLRGY